MLGSAIRSCGLAAVGEGGKRTISKISPSFVYNTVDNPIFPTTGTRYTLSIDFAGLGGNTNFIKPRVEGDLVSSRSTSRTSLGFRAQVEYIRPYGQHDGAADLRAAVSSAANTASAASTSASVGPRDPRHGLVLGGNKSLLFNAEYLITIAGPVRLVLFADAGQVRDIGQSFAWNEDKIQRTRATGS